MEGKNKAIEALFRIQQDLKAPKDKHNKFGNYDYRSAESIIEAVKPLLRENGCVLITKTESYELCGSVRVKATVKLIHVASGDSVETESCVKEDEQRAGMCAAQNSGSCESFVKKYALGDLFAIDDTTDDDDGEKSPLNPKNAPASKKEVKAPAKTVKPNLKAEAWLKFKSLAEYAKLDAKAQGEEFKKTVELLCGKVDGLADEDWKRVIGHIETLAK